MSLSPLTHKFVGTFLLPGSATASGTLSAVTTALQRTTYADGSARTPGSSCAWTVETILNGAQIIGTILSPPISTLGFKMILAGGSATGTPTMLSPDVYSSSRVQVGMVKNAGTYVSWSNANPWNSGSFSSYYGGVTPTSVSQVHVYESQETIWIIPETTAQTQYFIAGGAIIDPESSNASTAESDGRIYGMMITGYLGVGTVGHQLSAIGNQTISFHAAAAGNAHSIVFIPNASSTATIERQNVNYNALNASSMKNNANEFVRQQIFMEADGGGRFYGRLREVLTFPNALSNTKFLLSSVTNGYLLAASTSTAGQALLLKA